MEKGTGNEARERIINVAVELFSRKGYDATTVNDIAGAANVNKASARASGVNGSMRPASVHAHRDSTGASWAARQKHGILWNTWEE